MSQQALSQVLRQLPLYKNRHVLVNSSTADDAGVFRLDPDRALVQTVDFFTPIVDDPFQYGQIAAANALSDVYAMGGRPITALNIVAMPEETVSAAVLRKILRGGAAKTKEAGCALIGGHTIRNPEPVYGLAVTGVVSPKTMMTNARARPGDWLVLTKPLGTGIITTGIKRDLATAAIARKAVASMKRLNTVGAELAERHLARAATDITGFGLLGHLGSLCRASGVGASIHTGQLPVLGQEVWELVDRECIPGGSRQNHENANGFTDWGEATSAQKALLTDAQTSGGLLICVAKRNLTSALQLMKQNRTLCAAVIGRIERSRQPMIRIHP